MLGLRAVRSLRSALPQAKKAIIAQQAARTIASSSRVHSEPPPTLLGPGSKSGAVPTDFEQATGMERLQLLGQMEGIDIFNTGPLIMTKMGTLKEPIMVPSYVSWILSSYSLHFSTNGGRFQSEERIVGCSGWPVDSHDLIWITTNNHKEHHRCPECGNGMYTCAWSSSPWLIGWDA